jgi:hypothetical protein
VMSTLLISGTGHCSRLELYILLVDHGWSGVQSLGVDEMLRTNCWSCGLAVLRCCAVVFLTLRFESYNVRRFGQRWYN